MKLFKSFRIGLAILFVSAAYLSGISSEKSSSNRSFLLFDNQVITTNRISRKAFTTDQYHDDIKREKYAESCTITMFGSHEFQNKSNLQDVLLMEASTWLYSTVYNVRLLHKYDSYSEMRNSAGPQVNQELCLRNLRHLSQRARSMSREKYLSKDVNMALLLDTYGRAKEGFLGGAFFWPGTYEKCLSLKIDTPGGEQVSTRYCTAHQRVKEWSDENTPVDLLSGMTSGVCLPESCDSLDYKDKYKLVESLLSANERPVDSGQYKVADLYCLPDSESPLRSWWLQPKPVAAMICLLIWLTLQVYSTYRCERGDTISNSIYKPLSIANNIRSLFKTDSGGSKKRTNDKEEAKTESHYVDLRILEGVKVICMVYVIFGHVLMCISHVLNNSIELANISSIFFLVANNGPAFAVNSFFTITGLLTSYSVFKQNQSFNFITSPLKWTAFILYRYMRIMPMYALVVAYIKYLSKFTGSGPFWDYATSELSHRRTCEQESWSWTLMFAANFKPPLSHCIPSAWYLANDFQFFLATPIFLGILYARPRFGQALLYTCIFGGLAAGVAGMLSVDTDFRPILLFMPHGFKTYIMNFASNYTHPQNRIPAYLIGILIGYWLYRYERNRLKFANVNQRPASDQVVAEAPTDWPINMRKYGSAISAFVLCLCLAAPLIGTCIDYSKTGAKLVTAFLTPSFHLLFSISIGLYILLATTGHGNNHINRLLSASFWKPLSRLSLCVVLINIEVILYLTQSRTRDLYLNGPTHLTYNIISVLFSYLASVPLYVLFEAPIQAALNHLISVVIPKIVRGRMKSD